MPEPPPPPPGYIYPAMHVDRELMQRPSEGDLAAIPCKHCREVMRHLVEQVYSGAEIAPAQVVNAVVQSQIRVMAHAGAGHPEGTGSWIRRRFGV